jgi:DeoR family transcriptional regulator, suf operon transcriptional repressor
MTAPFVASDSVLLDLLRSRESMTVSALAEALQVTATAVRQRLTRLLAQEYVERTASGGRRGRPSHHYRLTEKGRRKAGSNFADLATVLWEEIRRIEDPQVRQGLLQRLAGRLAVMYEDKVHGRTLEERMRALLDLFSERQISLAVDTAGGLPVLTTATCPYPALAESDRDVCAMERDLFSRLLQNDMRLAGCRLDGDTCCTFQCN